MKIQFYLDEKSRKKAARDVMFAKRANDAKTGPLANMSFHERVGGVYFDADKEGVYTPHETLLGGLPQGLANLPFRMVVLYDESQETQLTQGEYKQGDTTAHVDHFTKAIKRDFGEGDRLLHVYRIRVMGKTLQDVERLYRDIRTRRATPTEAWGPILRPLQQPILVEITHSDIQQSEAGDTQETKSA